MKREQLLPSSTTFHSESTRALYLFFLFASDLIQLEIEKLNRDRDGRKKNWSHGSSSSSEFYPCVLSLRSLYISSIRIVLFQDSTSLSLFQITFYVGKLKLNQTLIDNNISRKRNYRIEVDSNQIDNQDINHDDMDSTLRKCVKMFKL